jgi:hypothetical protein
MPTKFFEGVQRNYAESDQIHTCRSFTFLRDYTTSRKATGPSYVERDLSIVDVRKHKIAKDRKAEVTAQFESLP